MPQKRQKHLRTGRCRRPVRQVPPDKPPGHIKRKNSNDSENHWNFNVIDGSHSKNSKKGCACGKCEPSVQPGDGSSIFYLFGPMPQKIEKSTILCMPGAHTRHLAAPAHAPRLGGYICGSSIPAIMRPTSSESKPPSGPSHVTIKFLG